MARLPDVQTDGVEAAPVPITTVAPTDFGMGEAAQQFGQSAGLQQRAQMAQIRAQAVKDREAAMPYVQKLQIANEDQLQKGAAAYTGETPGFASDQIKNFGSNVDANAPGADASPGVKAEYHRLATHLNNAYAERAALHEGQVLAKPIAEATANVQSAKVNNGLVSFQSDYEPKRQQLYLDHQATDTDLPTKVVSQFDASATAALAGVPDTLKPVLQAQLQGMRVKVFAEAQGFQLEHAQAHALQAANDQVGTLVSSVYQVPGSYTDASGTLDKIIATLPKGLQEQATRDGRTQLVTARINGLIEAGHPDTAVQELEAGHYDDVLHGTKEPLLARALSAQKGYQPQTADQIVTAHNYEDKVKAEAEARANGRTTGLDLSGAEAFLGQNGAAQARLLMQQADRVHAADGPIADMTSADLHAAAVAPDPEANDPEYVSKLQVTQIRRKLAADELQRRQTDPAGNLFDVSKKGPPTKGVGATSAAFERATALNQNWQQVATSSGPTQAAAARTLALSSLGQQAQQGVPEGQRKVIPQDYARALYAELHQAPDEQKLNVASRLGSIVEAMPDTVRLADGSYSHPRQILAQQLREAGMSSADVSAVVDFGGDRAKMGRYVQAAQDPQVAIKPDKQEQAQIKTLTDKVTARLKPFFDVAEPLPGSNDLYRARIDRSLIVARSLMARGASMDDAAKQATSDLTDGYRYVDGWRMPAAQAGGPAFVGYTGHNSTFLGFADGAGLARSGAAQALSALTAADGKHLMGVPGQDPRITAAQIGHSARWVSAPDDSGLMLMVPHPGGSYEQVRDHWGRPVTFTFQQLQNFGRGTGHADYEIPPAGAHYGGQAVPAYTKGQVFGAFLGAITGDGEHGKTGDLGPVTKSGQALGKFQLMPATVQTYAPQLGMPVDLQRARYDDAYGQKIASAALGAGLNRYSTTSGPGAYALAAAAYNAGPGNVDKWIAQYGDPRTGKISVDDWVERIPYGETRDYVKRVLPGAVRRLKSGAH